MSEPDVTIEMRVIEGPGVVARIGDEAHAFGTRALLVTDPGLVATGHVARAESALRASGVAVMRFDEVRENPTTDDVDHCVASAREFGPDLLVALGGGSSIDVAKAANFIVTGGGELGDYRGRGPRPGEEGFRFLPLIAVPTTAGTGSEGQSFSLIADPDTHAKIACGHPDALPSLAVLDPELTVSQPPFITACTGLDAIGHAVETTVTRRATPVSTELSRESFRLSVSAFPAVLRAGHDLEARGQMLRAAWLAGRAIENSMLGAAHSMANPLTARFALPHGQAVATMLPSVVRFNAHDSVAAGAYADLARSAALVSTGTNDEDAVASLVKRLEEFLELAGMPSSLAACGVRRSDCDELARDAAGQWTAGYNPRSVSTDEFRMLYEEACEG